MNIFNILKIFYFDTTFLQNKIINYLILISIIFCSCKKSYNIDTPNLEVENEKIRKDSNEEKPSLNNEKIVYRPDFSGKNGIQTYHLSSVDKEAFEKSTEVIWIDDIDVMNTKHNILNYLNRDNITNEKENHKINTNRLNFQKKESGILELTDLDSFNKILIRALFNDLILSMQSILVLIIMDYLSQ